MQFTPSQAAAHLKESIASYIESQYRISHPLLSARQQRSSLSGVGMCFSHIPSRNRRADRSV